MSSLFLLYSVYIIALRSAALAIFRSCEDTFVNSGQCVKFGSLLVEIETSHLYVLTRVAGGAWNSVVCLGRNEAKARHGRGVLKLAGFRSN
jgi:hypothetical protein